VVTTAGIHPATDGSDSTKTTDNAAPGPSSLPAASTPPSPSPLAFLSQGRIGLPVMGSISSPCTDTADCSHVASSSSTASYTGTTGSSHVRASLGTLPTLLLTNDFVFGQQDLTVFQLLRELDAIDPDADYGQYANGLMQSGFVWADMLVGDAVISFLHAELGIPIGAAQMLVAYAEELVCKSTVTGQV
jgi:hypothetical protein